jgi:predicted enzyme related to lactoylglutathione lyase
MKPTYFDLTVADLDAARSFFGALFGWRFEKFPMPYEYYRIATGPAGEPGIDGGIGAIADTALTGGRPWVNLTVPVADLDACIAKVLANGGKVIEPKLPVPGVGWYATCAEPGGLMFGMIQADSSVNSASTLTPGAR